jgi:hypothetical protein
VSRSVFVRHLPIVLPAILALACAEAPPERAPAADRSHAEADAALAAGLDRAAQLADSVDRLLLPVPLLTPTQEAALRRFGNAQQLARARALGVRPTDSAHVRQLLAEGRLVSIPDSTELWAVRRLEHSLPYVTPDALDLLQHIARRFQERLAARGLPAYRVEVTSVLRTPASQEDLRRTNINAAAGTSTHEYGTTLDLAYSSFAAPHEIAVPSLPSGTEWLAPHLRRATAAWLEAAAARKSRELQMILGEVLLALQEEGNVMVTLERQQPVYHLTMARARQ